VKTDGDAGFLPGIPAVVGEDGTFAWSRALDPTVGATVYFVGGGATSNSVFIPASASNVIISGTRAGTTITLSGVVTAPGPSSSVTIRSRAYGEAGFIEAGTATIAESGVFNFTLNAALNEGVAVYAEFDGRRSNTLSFDPLAPAIVVIGARFSGSRTLSANGQAFNVPVGTVLVPFVSLDGGPFKTGVGVRTLGTNGDFAWQRGVSADRSVAEIYFATAEGVESNFVTVSRS